MLQESSTFEDKSKKINLSQLIIKDISEIFENCFFILVYKSGASLESTLGNPKDKIDVLEKVSNF